MMRGMKEFKWEVIWADWKSVNTPEAGLSMQGHCRSAFRRCNKLQRLRWRKKPQRYGKVHCKMVGGTRMSWLLIG